MRLKWFILHLAYGIEIYGNTHANHLSRLMILNNTLLRILQNAPRDTPVVKLYANFNTLTLSNFILIKFWNLFITVFITKTVIHIYGRPM